MRYAFICLIALTGCQSQGEAQTTVQNASTGQPGAIGPTGPQGPQGIPGIQGPTGPAGSGFRPSHVMVESERRYTSTIQTTGVYQQPANTVSVRIPERLEVTYGNGGQMIARLMFDNGYCTYYGITSAQNPLSGSNVLDIEKGRHLYFQNCRDSSHVVIPSAQPGDTRTLGKVSLELNSNGDTTLPSTRIRAVLEVQ